MRINKYISSNSKYSRRKADELISAGRVFLNNQKVRELGTQVDPEIDRVRIDKLILNTKQEKLYIALNKPKGYISSRNDELNRETVMELVPKNKNLKPIGRLDKDTEGLLFFSNDGDFINRLTHPKFQCEKEYLVIIKGQLSNEEKEKLEKGVKVDGKKTTPATIKIISIQEATNTVKITIKEGRNRQIRKMFEQVEHPVKYLRRIRIGKIKLKTLRKGHYRSLTTKEIENAY